MRRLKNAPEFDFISRVNGAVEIPIVTNHGLYFLFENHKLIYIGKSINALFRIGTHNRNGLIFNKAIFLEYKFYNLHAVELACIRFFQPILNDERDKTEPRPSDLELINKLFCNDTNFLLSVYLKETKHKSSEKLKNINCFL